MEVDDNEWVLILGVVNICALLAGKFSIYSKHFSSKAVMVLVMTIEQAIFLGCAYISTTRTTLETCMLSSIIGSYVSAALWDSRSFNIESLSWRKKLAYQSFYVVVTVSILLVVSGTVRGSTELAVSVIVFQLICGVLLAEIIYSICKRKKLLSPAWRGMRIESRYDSRLSSTLTTPTSDRAIRI